MEKFLIKTGKEIVVFLPENAKDELVCASEEFCATVKTLIGETPQTRVFTGAFNAQGMNVFLACFSDLEKMGDYAQSAKIQTYSKELANTDGFAVCKEDEKIFILSHTPNGVYYGVHDFLEKNVSVIWPRGASEYAIEFLPLNGKQVEFSVFDYAEKSPFLIRTWNMCGTGSEGKQHADQGTAVYYAKNKINGVFHLVEQPWKKHGLRGCGICATYANNIDDLAETHPEYFMTDIEGGVKTSPHESFINYYNPEVAKVVAERFVAFLDTVDDSHLYELIMPDNPYFCVKENGVELSKQPFTTDDGYTVYPTDENYKSTVYFNYMNRVVRAINALRPNTDVLTFAYIYSEQKPSTKIDEHLVVSLAPIYTNEKYAYNDTKHLSNKKIAENIEGWSKVCKKLCIYSYWNSFKGTIYTRPILKQIKEDLLWFESLGIYGITAEGKLDCSIVPNSNDGQKNSRKFFDMNEACTWVINKLMWNPRLDVEALLRYYAKLVYKETASEFLEYYRLMEQGFESADAYVWYPTGGDVYILQFIVNAGIKEEVLGLLQTATEKATTQSVRLRWESIRETLEREIKKYADFIKEEGEILRVKKGADVLSESAMDYKNNADSIWNKAKPMKVLRNYENMEHYDKRADFECRMLFDGEVWYIGYSIADDKIDCSFIDQNGHIRIARTDGSTVDSYAETYIGGNELNQSVYYGYISGFMAKAGGSFYQNASIPTRIKEDCGLKDYYFVSSSENPEERYYFHVQAIPLSALRVTEAEFKPYGSFVYYTDRFGRAGWMGFGLWSKQNFQSFKIKNEE